jgi:hypothetical protein
VRFTGVTFSEKVTFWGTQRNPVFGPGAWAQFDRARIEKPELLTFNTVLLHPGWFINVDVRKVDFTDVRWYGMPGGPAGTLNEAIDALEQRGIEAPHTLLAQAYRRLSANAEENREYPLANEFHYWSMEALRRQSLRSLGLLGTLCWALSGYGVRPARAYSGLVVTLCSFALLYLIEGCVRVEETSLLGYLQAVWQAIIYSLTVGLNKVGSSGNVDSPQCAFMALIEGVLGSIQVALLVLALRRKFRQ